MDQKLTAEEKTRKSLEDVVLVAKSLSSVCGSIDELIEVVNLALTNDAQLRIVMKEITQQSKR